MKIADKIVTTLLALCTIPTVLFASLFHILYQISGMEAISSLLGNGAMAGDTGLTEDSISVMDIIRLMKEGILSFNGTVDYSAMDERVVKILPYLKWSMILFAVGTVICLALIAVCAATRSKTTQNIICGVGIADLAACGILFNKFSSPILDGTITSGTLFDSIMGGAMKEHPIIKTIFSSIMNIKELNLSSAWSMLIVIFAAILLWNIAYVLTLPKEKTRKVK